MKTALPKPVFYRLRKDVSDRLDCVSRTHMRDRNDIARDGLVREIARLEASAAPVSPDLLKLVTEAQRMGVDVPAVLRSELQKFAS